MKIAPVGACALAIGLLMPAARADLITFTGTGSQDGISKRFDITGTDFTFRVSTNEGSPVIRNCTPDVPCEIERPYSAGMPGSLLISSFASLGNVSTGLVSGRLVFVGTVTTPADIGAFETTVPIAFAGEVIGHYDSPGLPVAFDVVLGGPGTATFGGEVVDSATAVLNTARYSFSGTGLTESEIPEPGAAFLAAGGIGLLALLFRRRRAML
jgi:uncharacterized protein (TIGR03382 family)